MARVSTRAGSACSAMHGNGWVETGSDPISLASAAGVRQQQVGGGFLDEELAYLHRLLQSPLAHVRLVEEVLHHLEQHRRLVGVDDRQIEQRVGIAREDDAHRSE